MAQRVLGKQTLQFLNRPRIVSGAAIAGKKEGEGPLGKLFDQVVTDDTFFEETWEKAECRFFLTSIETCLQKVKVSPQQVGVLLGGDLTNQIMSASIAARELSTPFLGLYGACSTMAESLLIGAALVDGEYASHAVCAASSHFCTAERQFRFPLEYGSQRCPTCQWTVTGAGATLLTADEALPAMACITHGTIGKVVDWGVSDANNMGAAMAPAACAALRAHFGDTGRTPEDYDLIVSGDLGQVGHDLLLELMEKEGQPLIPDRYTDCGLLVFDQEQDVHAGGSGCGCSAITLNCLLLQKLAKREYSRILFMATGALMSPTSSQQGQTIPGVAHVLALEAIPCS